MLLRLQQYDYTIQYIPGQNMVLADRLSRFPSPCENLPIELHQNIHALNFHPDRLLIIKGAIECDPILSAVYRVTLNGWPNRIQDVPCLARHFWSLRDELMIEDGVLMKGNRICIPPELHDRTLYDLHDSHQGIEKMTHIARSNVYWPGIDADISDYVRRCTICTKFKASQSTQPMLPRDIPDSPWQELAADYFTHKGKDYLLIANTFSKYPFVYKVHSKTTDSIINRLQDLFSQFGKPQRFFSDNGPPFSSEPFSQFLTSHAINHITSSPLYPRSNGFIERQVKTIKTSLATTQASNTSLDQLLPTLCSTPIGPSLPSPCEILLNRTDPKPGHPSTPINLEQVRDYLITKRSAQKHYYDIRHNTRPLPDLSPSQDVLFLSPVDQMSYLEGTIVSQASMPRSYIIGAQGCKYRCNRHHIKPINTDPPSLLARPYIALQSHNIPYISGPQNSTQPQTHNNLIISGPPQPHQSTRNIRTMKMPTLNNAPHRPSIKSRKPTHQNCPYTRPCITKPSNCSIKPISGPPQQDKLCPYNVLMQLISLNGIAQPHISPSTSPSPSHSSCSSSSLDSNPVSPSSTKSTENTESSSESGSTSSLESTASDCQLRLHLPIWYNETFLMKLNGKPQVATLNYLSIPLPPSDTDEEEDMDMT